MPSAFASEGRKYLELDYSVIPILPGSKRPGIYAGGVWQGMNTWNCYSERFATEEELQEWEKWIDSGIGLLTGAISGVVAADFDLREDIHRALEEIMPPSPVRKAGAKGYTAFYRYNNEPNQKWSVGGDTVLEILSTGRQTLLPPTIHPSGVPYKWLTLDTLATISREDLPILPTEAEIQAVFARFDPKFQSGRPSASEYRSNFGDGRLFLEDFDRTKEALRFLSSDDYHYWVSIGMAIHSAFPEQNGLDLWRSWSENSEKYKPGDCEGKWPGFANSISRGKRPLTIATILKDANKAGWKDVSTKTGLHSAVSKLERAPEIKSSYVIPEPIARSAPGLVGKIVDWILETSIRRQPALALASALSFVGAIKGQRVKSPTDLRTNLFMLGLAPSGSGKQQPLKAVQQLAATLPNLQDLLAGEPTSDAGLLSLLKSDYAPKLILWDEFGLALKGITSENASSHATAIIKWLQQIFSHANCKLSGKEYANVDGKFKRIDLNNPHLCLCCVTAPGAFYKNIKSEYAASGFLPRFLILETENAFPTKQANPRSLSDIPVDILDECGEILSLPRNVNPLGNVDQSIKPKMLPISLEAQELLDEKDSYYESRMLEANNKRNDGLLNIWARATEHVIKVGLTVSGTDEISFEAMQFAVNLVELCLDAMSETLVNNISDTRYGESSQRCLNLIEQCGASGIPQRDLTQKTRGISRVERDSVLKDLLESGLIAQEMLTTSGRPKVVYIHSKFIVKEFDA